MNTLIRNGKVVTATQTIAADVLIEGELIKEVRAAIPANSAAKVIDATGMYVLPGGIDCRRGDRSSRCGTRRPRACGEARRRVRGWSVRDRPGGPCAAGAVPREVPRTSCGVGLR